MNRLYFVLTMLLRSTTLLTSCTPHDQLCRLSDDFPIQKISDKDVCHLEESIDENTKRAVELQRRVDMTSFVQNPTKGQRLILVPRNSDLTIRLDDNVSYQLRQRQQLHNTNSDDLMGVPLSINGFKVMSELAEEIFLHHDTNHTTDRQRVDKEVSKKDAVPLLLKSHPGQALVPLHKDLMSGGFMLEQLHYADIGIGSESEAIHVRLQEPTVLSRSGDNNDGTIRYALINTDGWVFIVSSSQLKVGSPVTMTSLLNLDDNVGDIDIALAYFATNIEYRCPFVVNTDGSISPLEAPHLAIGISRFPAVTLMERFSPNRFIFQNAETFWNAPAPVNGTALVLKSHPGLAVVTYPRYRGAFGLVNVMDVLVGPANNDTYRTLHLLARDSFRHHDFTLRDATGANLVPMSMNLFPDVPLKLMKYNVSQSTFVNAVLSLLIQTERNATWIINAEGSISPVNAPHLVLGCRYVSDFVDKEIAMKHRLMLQSNVMMDETHRTTVVQSKLVGNENRILHGFVWFLIVEGYLRFVALVIIISMIVVIKLVPMSIWTMIVLQLTLGTVACVFYIICIISSLATRALFTRFKKQNVQHIVR
jgi:hypothetical protein